MISAQKALLRLFSALTLTIFVASDVAYAAPVGGASAPVAVEFRASAQQLAANPSLLEIPSRSATLKEAHRGTNGKFIIHIQDAHSNLSGQQNLARTLEHLIKGYGIDLVLVEGADREATLSDVREAAPLDEWRLAAKRFLFDGMISGEEYLNLTTRLPMKIIGVEQRRLYDRNLKAYANLVEKRQKALDYLRDIQRALERVKNRTYPADLLDYENRKSQQTPDGFTANLDSLMDLVKKAGITIDNHYPQTLRLESVRSLEKSIDFAKAGLEQQSLVAAAKTPHTAGKKAPVDSSATDPMGAEKNSESARSAALAKLLRNSEQAGINIGAYPELVKYAEYLKRFTSLEMDALITEHEGLEEAAYAKLLDTDAAQKIRAIDRYADLLRRAYAVEMSSKDFKTYLANVADFPTLSWQAFLNTKLIELGGAEDIVPYREDFEKGDAYLRQFYKWVNRRDDIFVRNTRRVMQKQDSDTAFLVTGGYHTAHLTELLRKEGYSYVVLAPVITSETNRTDYEKILLGSSVQDKTKPVAASSNIRAWAARGNSRFLQHSLVSGRFFRLANRIHTPTQTADVGAHNKSTVSVNSPQAHGSRALTLLIAGPRRWLTNLLLKVGATTGHEINSEVGGESTDSHSNSHQSVLFDTHASELHNTRASDSHHSLPLQNPDVAGTVDLVEAEEAERLAKIHLANEEKRILNEIADTAIKIRLHELWVNGKISEHTYKTSKILEIGSGTYSRVYAVDHEDGEGNSVRLGWVYKLHSVKTPLRVSVGDDKSDGELAELLNRRGNIAAITTDVTQGLEDILDIKGIHLTEQELGLELRSAFETAMQLDDPTDTRNRLEKIVVGYFDTLRALFSMGLFFDDVSMRNMLLVERLNLDGKTRMAVVVHDFDHVVEFNLDGEFAARFSRTITSRDRGDQSSGGSLSRLGSVRADRPTEEEVITRTVLVPNNPAASTRASSDQVDLDQENYRRYVMSDLRLLEFIYWILEPLIQHPDRSEDEKASHLWEVYQKALKDYGLDELLPLAQDQNWPDIAKSISKTRSDFLADKISGLKNRMIPTLLSQLEAGTSGSFGVNKLRAQIISHSRNQTLSDQQNLFQAPAGFIGTLSDFDGASTNPNTADTRHGSSHAKRTPSGSPRQSGSSHQPVTMSQNQTPSNEIGVAVGFSMPAIAGARLLLPRGVSFAGFRAVVLSALMAVPSFVGIAEAASSAKVAPFAIELPLGDNDNADNSYAVFQPSGNRGIQVLVDSNGETTSDLQSGAFVAITTTNATAINQSDLTGPTTSWSSINQKVERSLALEEQIMGLRHNALSVLRDLEALLAEGRTPGGVVFYLQDWVGDDSKGAEDPTFLATLAQAQKFFGAVSALGFGIQIVGPDALAQVATEKGLGQYLSSLPPDLRATHVGSANTLAALQLANGQAVLLALKPSPSAGQLDIVDMMGNFRIAADLSSTQPEQPIDPKLVGFIATRKGLSAAASAHIAGLLTKLAAGDKSQRVLARARRYVALPPIRAIQITDFIQWMQKLGRMVIESA